MRLMSRLMLLAILGTGALAVFNWWTAHGGTLRSNAAAFDAEAARRQATTLANRAVVETQFAASKLGATVGDSALTAKIKSKMALDDNVDAHAIDVTTSGSIVTVTGVVRSTSEHDRVLRLASETKGVIRVVDKLRIRRP